MTDSGTAALAAELTSRLEAVEGVLKVFPRNPVTSAIRAVTETAPAPVELEAERATLAVAARIGIARSVPVAAVIDRIVEDLPDRDGGRHLRLDLEIAYIG